MTFASLALGVILMSSTQTSDPKSALDFWVGDWDVYTGKDLDGHDLVEKILGGAAIIENWTDADGTEGKSLFYYMPAKSAWKQVWVTPAGPYKEKVSHNVKDGLQFVGTVFLADGREIPDRTTLTPLSDGTVHQVIEYSKDHGKTWVTSFDAIYKRKKKQ
jgi:hypothetical protein